MDKLLFIWLVKLSLRIIRPFIILLPVLLKDNKDNIRHFYISLNNIFVQSKSVRYRAGEVLVLLPHCLQDSNCGYKVTNSIMNCHRCGKCCIGNIADIMEDTGVAALVVTGGTAARGAVEKHKPKMILSVACERELTSGIADIGSIPAIGIVNERPNGPCNNTLVDVNLLRQKLETIIEIKRGR